MSTSPRFYLAGPMSNIPQHNFPAFDQAAHRLRSMGFEIVSPAELDSPAERARCLASPDGKDKGPDSWGTLLSRDVALIADCVDGIIFLPHWVSSRGARLEAYVALLCGKEKFAFYTAVSTLYWVPPDFIRNELRSNMP
jgi:hypothetical protein